VIGRRASVKDVGSASEDARETTRAAVTQVDDAGYPVMILAEATLDASTTAPDYDGPLDYVSVLVPPDSAATILDLLVQAGWMLPPDAARERTLGPIAVRHAWPLVRGRAALDLHHFATALNRLRGDDDRLWKYSASLPWRGRRVQTPRPEHALLLALVEGRCGPPQRRPAWIERACQLLDGRPLDWTELLHDIRLRYLEAIVHRGLEESIREHGAKVPWGVLQNLEVDSTDIQREEAARLEASAAPSAAPGTSPDYTLALARYRRRHDLADPIQAATAPSATLSFELPTDGAAAWVEFPTAQVSTDWLVLSLTAELPPTVEGLDITMRVMLPGLPVGTIATKPAGSGPRRRFTAMLPFHRGFLGDRGIDRIGIDFQRNGLPIAWEQPVAMRIACLMALTAAQSAARAATLTATLQETPQADVRFLLCRPRGGLNDTLNQIEACWAYAERHGRRLYVDTLRSGLHAPFSDYFRPRDAAADVVLHPAPEDEAAFERLATEPPGIAGRIASYTTRADSFPVTFDRERDHAAPLLVHEQFGGGTASLDALRRLRFTPPVAGIIRARIAPLGTGYVGVHLRHTDLQLGDAGFLGTLRESLAGRRVLVCSDDARLLEEAPRILAGSTVLAASAIMDTGGLPQHHAASFPETASRRRANLDALVDLVALGAAEEVLLPCPSGRISGFGRLAKLLSEHREVLAGLLE